MTPAAIELVVAFYDYVHTLVRFLSPRFIDDPGLEHSVANEALCEAAMAFDGRVGSFKPFLATVLRRRLIDELRRHHGRFEHSPRRQWMVLSLDHAPDDGDLSLADRTPDPPSEADEDLDLYEMVGAAWRRLRLGLSDREREVIELPLLGWLQRDLADRWGVTEARVGQIRHAVLERLRALVHES